MTPLSPIEALGPAFERTRQIFGKPFRLGFFLKIALVAALTQPSFISGVISYPMQAVNFGMAGRMGRVHHFAVTPAVAGIGLFLLIFGFIGIAVWVLLTWLFCRLRFTLFDIVLYRRTLVGEAWRPYRRQAWRYFGLYLIALLAFFLVAAVLAGPAFIHFFHVLVRLDKANPDPFAMMGAMLPFIVSILAVGLLWAIVDAILQDFLLPPMAIEDAPIEGALSRFVYLARTGFGSLLLYLLMRFVVALGLAWALTLIALILIAIPAAIGGGLGFILYRVLWHAGTGGQVAFILYAAIGALIIVALYITALVAIYGTTAIFKQSYALLYYGGRYPELGSRLDGLPTAPAAPPAPAFEPPMAPPAAPLPEPPALW
jgi:hypothetical protein